MTAPNKQKFLVLYLAPVAVIENWMKTDASVREPAEKKMRAEWMQWMQDHGAMIVTTEAAGATKQVTSGGVSDTKNDVMLYAFVEADSHEAAANAFKGHPHLGIPQASIQVTAVRPIGPM